MKNLTAKTWALPGLPRLLVAGIVVLGLTGCGFHSMYGETGNNPSVVEALSGVEIGSVTALAGKEYAGATASGNEERMSQLVRNNLLDRLDATGPGTPVYRLDVKLVLDSEGIGYRTDEAITRVNMRLNAEYALVDIATGKTVFANKALAMNAYDVVRSDFATLSARQDVERRLVPEVSDQIITRLGLYFRYPAKTLPPAQP